MGLNYARLIVLLILTVGIVCQKDRKAQSYVKIDVSKVNQKLDNETIQSTVAAVNGSETTTEMTTTTATSSTSTTTTTAGQTDAVTKSETTISTTPATTTTENASTTTESVPFEPPKEARLIKKVPSGYYCRCDLKVNICDVNCCCDIDCSSEILKTFSCDEEQLDIAEYHHQDGLQSCEVQGGLFCLVGEHHDEADSAFYDPKLKQAASKHKWKDIFPVDAGPARGKSSPSYRVGELVRMYNETSEKVETFSFPYSITNSQCQLLQPVRFLQNQASECLRSYEDLEAFTTSFLEQQMHIRYLRVPKTEIMEHCMDEDCFNSSVKFCNLSGRDCQKSNKTGDLEDPWYCTELRIEFVHNYTHLEEMNVRMLCGSLDFSGLEEDSVWQKLSVEFKRKDEEKFSRTVSGNLGYLKGKPLIVSTLQIPENDTAEERRSKKYMLSYFTNGTRDPDESFRMKLPRSKRSKCVVDPEFHEDILFGENSWIKCNYSPQQNVSSDSNFTKVCNNLQKEILDLITFNIHPQIQSGNYDSINLYLSKYGNPVNRSSEWIQLRSSNFINEQVSAAGSHSTSHFSCKNMLINAKYNFFHARQTVRNVPRQHVLREAELVFGPRVDLRFALEEDIRVPIFVQVQFFDLTNSSGGGGTMSSGLGLWVLEVGILALVVSFKVV